MTRQLMTGDATITNGCNTYSQYECGRWSDLPLPEDGLLEVFQPVLTGPLSLLFSD